jgi:hypothetical protein
VAAEERLAIGQQPLAPVHEARRIAVGRGQAKLSVQPPLPPEVQPVVVPAVLLGRRADEVVALPAELREGHAVLRCEGRTQRGAGCARKRRKLQPLQHEPRVIVVSTLRHDRRHAHRARLRDRREPVRLRLQQRRTVRLRDLHEVLHAARGVLAVEPERRVDAAAGNRRDRADRVVRPCRVHHGALEDEAKRGVHRGIRQAAARSRSKAATRSAHRSSTSSRPMCRRISGPPVHGLTSRPCRRLAGTTRLS